MPICFIIRPEFHQWRCPDPFSTRLQGVCDKLGQSGDESSVYMVRRTPLKGHSRNLTIHNKLVNIISLKNACLDVTVVSSPDPHPRREARTSKRLMLQSHATGMQDMFWPMPGLIICMDWGDETPWVSVLKHVPLYMYIAYLQIFNVQMGVVSVLFTVIVGLNLAMILSSHAANFLSQTNHKD